MTVQCKTVGNTCKPILLEAQLYDSGTLQIYLVPKYNFAPKVFPKSKYCSNHISEYQIWLHPYDFLNPCIMLPKNHIDYVAGHFVPYCVNPLRIVKKLE